MWKTENNQQMLGCGELEKRPSPEGIALISSLAPFCLGFLI